MSKSTKKHLSLLLTFTLLLGCFGMSFTAFGEDEVAINSTNFPDPVFRDILLNYKDENGDRMFDKDGNERLSAAEREKSVITISGVMADNKQIKTLKGIEYFADSLTVLRCGRIGLEELDVSALYNLTSLTCQGNYLSALDVSANTKLITLNCSANNDTLTSLTLGSLPSLDFLHCYANMIESIDVSQCPALTDFRCDQNELTSLDVSGNTMLQKFTCANNHLRTLDLSKNTALDTVVASSIGEQTTAAAAELNGAEIGVSFEFENPQCITSTSVDLDEPGSGYYSGAFYAYNVRDIDCGIDYTYSTQLENCEDMEVHIDVSRDFYQVDFYAAEDMQELLASKLTKEHGRVIAPDLTYTPQCKAFEGWSEDITDVTRDMQVYIVWRDSHSYSLTDFKYGTATITCSECGNSYTVKFEDCINAFTGDGNYCEYIDVVSDGCINAKDYAQLEKMF